ncbi:hypothetical protein [Shewanella sp.]|uniref:hypothetical protein n=1 Tax=Shewanella sp. TaxID=50422 RepID=UPI004047C24E
MSQSQDHDAEFAALHTEIKPLYHQQSLEQPAAELDEAILAKARTAHHVVAKQRGAHLSLWRRNAWLFSTAASVMLVAGLFILSPSLQQQVGLNLEQGLPVPVGGTEQIDDQQAMSQSSADISLNAASEQAIAVEGMSMRAAPERQENPVSASHHEAVIDHTPADKMPMRDALTQAESVRQAQAAKQAADADAAQQKAAALPVRQQDKELKHMKQQFERNPKGDIELDTAELALARLQALLADNKLKQAEGYMITMEQRFPELLSPAHPLYKQYQKIKAQLTSQ